jgi:hypothetical protein
MGAQGWPAISVTDPRGPRGIDDPAPRTSWLQARTKHLKCFVRRRHVVRNASGVRSAIRKRHHSSFRKGILPLHLLRDFIICFPVHGCEGDFFLPAHMRMSSRVFFVLLAARGPRSVCEQAHDLQAMITTSSHRDLMCWRRDPKGSLTACRRVDNLP